MSLCICVHGDCMYIGFACTRDLRVHITLLQSTIKIKKKNVTRFYFHYHYFFIFNPFFMSLCMCVHWGVACTRDLRVHSTLLQATIKIKKKT